MRATDPGQLLYIKKTVFGAKRIVSADKSAGEDIEGREAATAAAAAAEANRWRHCKISWTCQHLSFWKEKK